MRTRRFLVAAAGAAAAALLLAGCVDNTPSAGPSSSGGTASAPAVTKDAALYDALPSAIKSSGVLSVGMDDTYAPNEFKDANGNPVGWDVELTNAIAAKLGLKPQYNIAKFDNILPSITGGKDDMGVSSFTDTVEREKQVDFVNYYQAGITWASPKGKTVDPKNACGLKVAVQTATYENTDEVPAKSKACTDAGKKPIQMFPYDAQDQATNAVILGQVDAMSADSPVTAYAIKTTGDKLQTAGAAFDVAPYGFPIAKGSALTPLVQKAVQALIDDGTYMKILDKWGVGDGAVKTAEINLASKS
jgi:polar amino acid transport system substrate-binding protein